MKIIKQRRDVPDWAASISQSSEETTASPKPEGVASLEGVKRLGRFREWLKARREKKELKKRRKIAGKDWPRWKVHYVHAHIRRNNGTYEVVSWDYRDPVPDTLTREFYFRDGCIMRLHGWIPLAKNWSIPKKVLATMQPRRHGIIFYSEGRLDPWMANDMCVSDDRKQWSPELLKRYAETNMDEKMLNSMQDKKTMDRKTLIIIMVAVAGVIIATRMMGMW